MLRPAFVIASVGAALVCTTPAVACGMHGGGFGYGYDPYSYGYEPAGMTLEQQLAAAKEARARYKREREAELERARNAFASRFKVDPVPAEAAAGELALNDRQSPASLPQGAASH
jgi:hypothetical protein